MNRIKICLPKLITKEQVAFVPGRSMSNHCLLAQEVFNKFIFSTCKKVLWRSRWTWSKPMIACAGQLFKNLWKGSVSLLKSLCLSWNVCKKLDTLF
ncbi:hypothetical protein MA16_Dca012374 [Dendrobium catenatum]|uniref:Reverse transcriptase domain-containing protein n=1 Tax=Dendrobium catenatum TaxID=906689 RepID=A0A2I0VI55_9ASPA|nr:hypothetical protein MA16_Dca012374 [Dendrobium catenatum]